MYKRILVPLDGSGLAERILPHVRFIARQFESTIVLLHVLDPALHGEGGVEPLQWQIQKAETGVYIQQIASQLQEQQFAVETVVIEGKAPETIVEFAHKENIDLLALTSHGAAGMTRWNASSITQKVVSKVFVNLLLVRSYVEPSERADEEIYQRILLPLDCSRRAECSLPVAVSLAKGENAHLYLAAVLKKPEFPVPAPYSTDIDEMIESFMRFGRKSIEMYMEELQKRIPVEVELLISESDSVSHTIHELADQVDADLVLFCAHGQTGRFQWPYGSITSNYLEYGNRSVMVIQDVPLSRMAPSAAEIAAEKQGRR